MIATGIVRRIDDLGRIVIPKELREKVFGKRNADGEPMEFYYEKDEDNVTLILKPYKISEIDENKKEKRKNKMKEEINVKKLIEKFDDMAKRETLLARGGISQQDLLMQIIGTIVVVAMEED